MAAAATTIPQPNSTDQQTTTDPQLDQKQQLVDELKDTVADLLSDQVDEEAQFEKVYQYLRLDKADKYYRGIQYLARWISPNGQAGYQSVGVPSQVNAGDQGSQQLLDYNIDIIQTLGRKFEATLGQRPFYNTKCVPNNPHNEADRQAAREADKINAILDSWWDVKEINGMLAYHAWKSGTTWGYVRWVADSEKYGYSEEPIISTERVVLEPGGYQCLNCGTKSPELAVSPVDDGMGGESDETVCPACMAPLGQESYQDPVEADVPRDTGQTKKYANGQVEISLLNGNFITVPFFSVDRQELPFLQHVEEVPNGKLLSLYPQLRDKYKGGSFQFDSNGSGVEGGAAEQIGTITRAAAESQLGVPRQQGKNRSKYYRTFIRPFLYQMVKDQAKREMLEQNFPDGLKVCRIESEVVDLANERIDDYFQEMQPEFGDYIVRPGICWGILQHQDAINDTYNQLAEIVERTNTVHLVDPDIIDIDQWSNNRNTPMEMIAAKPGAGQSLDSAVKTLQPAKFPPEAMGLIQAFKENAESNTGVLPNIYGAGGGGTEQTAEQSRNELNQALMQLGTTGEYMIRFWVGVRTLAIKEYARNAPKGQAVAVKGQTQPGAAAEEVDTDALFGGNFHLEGEIGIPRSYAERKDELKSLINAQGPAAAAMVSALGIDNPVNSGVVKDALDLPEMQDPQDELRRYVQNIIKQLLEGQAIQQPMPDGSTQMQPSIPFDALLLDPAQTTEIVRMWALSDAASKLQGTPGYQNVMAYLQSVKQAMMPPPMPPGGPDGGPPGAPSGGPPPPQGPPPQVNHAQTPTGQSVPSTGAGGPMMPQ